MTVTAKQALEINRTMLPIIASLGDLLSDDSDVDYLRMIGDDLAYNARILQEFNASGDAMALHAAIMRQDTSPREEFYDVLVYIEREGLIPRQRFTCV
jgi:hypothetical protein